ncbi:DegV family EDD domain-containing protein [Acetobacterium paludosum]|uniref:DegV family EDD domain-containing protein n=1 Tax=Acetobacterium paludosum TaxID=52693 RepID=A0A923HQU8_9FIRM|nr:DegV family protein [Acetobacterium paludosum]MBC3886711.1 DegV family EDD domain-containing protein [Acetobacterium paludosum]
MAIKFIVDSMCDTNSNILSRYEFDILPIPITLDDKTYFDGIDITPEMIVDFVNNNKNSFPKTAQIQPLAIIDTIEKHLKNDDDVIYLAFSSKLSGTYQTAQLLAKDLQAKYPHRKITIIDSLSATTGTALILYQGLKLNKLNRSYAEIVETMTFLSQHAQIFFMVGDIKWLAQGGRISRNAAMLGDMLKIVPILYFNDGEILVYEKIRGQKKALRKLLATVEEKTKKNKEQIIGFIQSTALDLQEKAKRHLEKELGTKNFMIPQGAGAALTVHIGPHCLGIMFFDELPDNYVNVCP